MANCFMTSNNAGNMGWARAWALSLHARMFNKANVETDIVDLLVNLTHNSLLDAGPPAGFQIDGNFGGVSGITEMLLQSHAGEIELLPALPDAWPTGSFRGLRARGGFEVALEWTAGRVTRAEVRSPLGGPVRIRTPHPVRVEGADADRPEENEDETE